MKTIKSSVSDIKCINTLEALQSSEYQEDPRKGVQNALKSRRNQLVKEIQLRDEYHEMMAFELQHTDSFVAGIDEAGRGPLAGEVVAAAVILPADFYLPGLNDSKKLSLKKRLSFREIIMQEADYGIGIATVEEIDEMNIYEAAKCAMKRAVSNLKKQPDHLLVDAMTLNCGIEETSLIKGDQRSVSIAAASIIAKTTRDSMMEAYDLKYPGYDFSKNKGYGTSTHLDGLEKNGITPIHRKTFEPIKSKFTVK
ncbi:ribonuclease HII [Corticicoccus populi]|uniref:Ribonuclease HII n=1 Tax=Corticicoccus populi TaxID=1812821 RepID=A0ABW5WTL7_9STAP